MTPDKQKQKLAGHASIAQKIFQHIPVTEEWTAAQIGGAMARATGSRTDPRTLGGCLMTMVDSGLVRATSRGTFQRTPVSQQITKTEKEPAAMTTISKITPPASQPVTSAIDLFAGIASKLRAIAADIEAAALTFEEGQAKTSEEVAKFKQLQALLKGLA